MTENDKREIKEMFEHHTGALVEAVRDEIKLVVEMHNHTDEKTNKNTKDIEELKSDITDIRYDLGNRADKAKFA